MIETRSTKLLTLVLLVGALFGSLLWAGPVEPDLNHNVYPDENDFVVGYDSFVGSQIETDGKVITTDPIVIEVSPDGRSSFELTLTEVDLTTIQRDDEISVFGTLKPDNTVSVINMTVRSPWEFQYMYLVSGVAGVWTLGRFLHHWHLHTETLSFTPRESE